MHLPHAFAILSLLSHLPLPTTAIPTEQRILAAPPLQTTSSEKYRGHKRPTSLSVLKVLERAEIIPTVLDAFYPSFLLNVTWGPHASAALGNTLAPEKLQGTPSVVLEEPRDGKKKKKHDDDDDDDDDKDLRKRALVVAEAEAEAKAPFNNLVITMTDPDAPTRSNPEWSEFCHWIAIGLPLNLSDSSTSTSTDAMTRPFKDIVEYKPPAPPASTGKHRYVLTAWAPANGTSVPLHLVAPKERRHWGKEEYAGVREWAKEMGLAAIGANFVYAEHE